MAEGILERSRAMLCDDVLGHVGSYVKNTNKQTRVYPTLYKELETEPALRTVFKTYIRDAVIDVWSLFDCLRIRYPVQKNGFNSEFLVEVYLCKSVFDRSLLLKYLQPKYQIPHTFNRQFFQRRRTQNTTQRYYVLMRKCYRIGI